MVDNEVIVIWAYYIIIASMIIMIIIILGGLMWELHSNNVLCKNLNYDYYNDKTEDFISCCKKTNHLNEHGTFLKECGVFKK